MSRSQHFSCSLQYTVYGYDGREPRASVLRFSGQRKEPATGHYLLGSGYRAFNPVLMRFHSPDSLSPMGAGGLNCYAYCGGDPVNNIDPSGHMRRSSLGGRSSHTNAPMTSSRKPTVPKQPTEYSSNDIKPFASHIAGRPSETFQDLIGYQGRDTGKWIDELRTRTKFSPKDLPVMDGAGASATRDVLKLHADMVTNPPESWDDVRYVAAQRLIDGLEKIEFLKVRAQASMERDKVRADWFEPPKKSG